MCLRSLAFFVNLMSDCLMIWSVRCGGDRNRIFFKFINERFQFTKLSLIASTHGNNVRIVDFLSNDAVPSLSSLSIDGLVRRHIGLG